MEPLISKKRESNNRWHCVPILICKLLARYGIHCSRPSGDRTKNKHTEIQFFFFGKRVVNKRGTTSSCFEFFSILCLSNSAVLSHKLCGIFGILIVRGGRVSARRLLPNAISLCFLMLILCFISDN